MDRSVQIEVENCLRVLQKGGSLLYPTDTIWGVGCDATDQKAVAEIYRIKQRPEDRSFIVLLDSPAKLPLYVESVPPLVYDLMEAIDLPLTIVYPKGKNIALNVLGLDGSIAIRVVRDNFCHHLIKAFGKPIVSTSANISGEASPITFLNISDKIRESVDHVVDPSLGKTNKPQPSRIIKIEADGMFTVIRR